MRATIPRQLLLAGATLGLAALLLQAAPRPAGASAGAPAAAGASAGQGHRYYVGHGFDDCSLPSLARLRSLGGTGFHAIAVYIGGPDAGCPEPLSAAWVHGAVGLGWSLIPTYVGLQAPVPRCGCPAIDAPHAYSQGYSEAMGAMARLASIGIGRGNVVYDDMEGYTRGGVNTPPVLSFLAGWTRALTQHGYVSGVYASAASGIADLVEEQEHGPKGYPLPHSIWIADWNGQQTVSDRWVPAALWVGHQRLHQYNGGQSLGGLAVDADYCDGTVVDSRSL